MQNAEAIKEPRVPPVRELLSCVKAADVAQLLRLDKKKYVAKVKALHEKREQFITRWKAIRDYQLPYIGEFEDTDDETNAARRKDKHIYHSVAWEANQIFSAGVMSGLTPPARKWFRLAFSDQGLSNQEGIGALLDQRVEIMNNVLAKSNFYNVIHSCYLELAFGQAPLAIFPDTKYGVHFKTFTVGTYMLEDGPDGAINTFVHKYRMTAQQLADKFGLENLPHNIRHELATSSGMAKKYKVIWMVEPNRMTVPDKLFSFYKPYLSLYWLEQSDADEWLYIGGFDEFPVPVARYLVTGSDTYGKGPGWFAEGDAKGLQLLEKDDITAVELGVKPPMLATADNALKGINLVPGGKTYSAQPDAVKPLFNVALNLEHLQQKIVDLENRIKRAYNADLFLMLNNMEDKTMTAREVLERTQEKLTQLGPVVQRLQFEFLSPIIERVYNILDRAGVFPQPEDRELAEFLANEEIKIEYISPLEQAQKISGITNIEQLMQFTGQLAQFDQAVLDKIDFIEVVNKYAEMIGTPDSIRRSDKEFEEIQAQKQQQQQQQEQMMQMQQMAQTAAPAAQAAKNIAEATREPNPIVAQAMNQLGAGGETYVE